MTATSRLAKALDGGGHILTAEYLPPRAGDAATIKKMAALLPATLDAVVVADNPEEVRGSALASAAILAAEGREPVLSLVTRDRNRIALESEVLGASALGVHNFLALSGEHQTLGVSPHAAGVFDMDSIQLTLALRRMAEDGTDFAGRQLDAPLPLCVGAVAHPYLKPMELNLLRLRKKVQAGARFLLTQAVFDVAGFAAWMDAVRAAGLDRQVAILASVLPLASVPQAQKLQERRTYGPVSDEVVARLSKATDPAKEGISIAAEMASKVKAIGGVRGIHILSGGNEASAARVIEAAGLAPAAR